MSENQLVDDGTLADKPVEDAVLEGEDATDTDTRRDRRRGRKQTSGGGKRNRCVASIEDRTGAVVMKLKQEDFRIISFRADPEPDPDTVERYVEALSLKHVLPPLPGFKDTDSGKIFTGGGVHRAAAYAKRKMDIPVSVVEVENAERAARKHALQANHDSGRPRSNEDKRRAVEEALKDEEWGQLLPNDIARLTQTSHTYVWNIKKRNAARQTLSTSGNEKPESVPEPERKQSLEFRSGIHSGYGVADGEPAVESSPPENTTVEVLPSDPVSKTTKKELRRMLDTAQTLPLVQDWAADAEDGEVLKALQAEIKRLLELRLASTKIESRRLKAFMEKHGIKMVTLAKRLGFSSHANISRWCNGKTQPQGKSVELLEQMLALDGEALTSWLNQDSDEAADMGDGDEE